MTSPTQEQLKKLEKLSKLQNEGQVILLETLEEIKDDLKELIGSISTDLQEKIDEVSDEKIHSKHMAMTMEKIDELKNEEITIELNIV